MTSVTPRILEKEKDFAIALAREAGTMILEYYHQFHAGKRATDSVREPFISWKSADDPVTKADQAVNSFCAAKIRAAFPLDGLLTEEMPDDGTRHQAERTWILDPIDGTKEFIAGRIGFAVMIGLLVQGKPRLGVVYQPLSDKLYWGLAQQGAYLVHAAQQRKIYASTVQRLKQVRLVRSVSVRAGWMNQWMKKFRIQDELQIGSIGIKLCLIAGGECDAYIYTGTRIKLWDTCAPEVILKEAGGMLTTFQGKDLDYQGATLEHAFGVVASNGRLHSLLLSSLQMLLGP